MAILFYQIILHEKNANVSSTLQHHGLVFLQSPITTCNWAQNFNLLLLCTMILKRDSNLTKFVNFNLHLVMKQNGQVTLKTITSSMKNQIENILDMHSTKLQCVLHHMTIKSCMGYRLRWQHINSMASRKSTKYFKYVKLTHYHSMLYAYLQNPLVPQMLLVVHFHLPTMKQRMQMAESISRQ